MDVPSPTPATGPRVPWSAARLATAGMRAGAVITLIDLALVVAKYEDRVGLATHDSSALPMFGFLAALVELAVPLDVVLMTTGTLWALTVLVTGAALNFWSAQVAPHADRWKPARWWVAPLVTVALMVAGAVWRTAVAGGAISGEQMRDTRVLAYLLWTAEAAAVWFVAARGRKAVRRITEARAARVRASAG